MPWRLTVRATHIWQCVAGMSLHIDTAMAQTSCLSTGIVMPAAAVLWQGSEILDHGVMLARAPSQTACEIDDWSHLMYSCIGAGAL